MSNQNRFRDQITVILGIALLSSFVVLSWVPRSCPLVRKWLVGCPAPRLAFQTPEEQELNRIPHQTIEGPAAEIGVKSQDLRGNTRITFYYRAPAEAKITLSIEQETSLIPLALVTHPLLTSLGWSKQTQTLPNATLFQKTDSQLSIDEIINGNTPLAADEAAIRYFKIPTGRYQRLEKLDTLDSTATILTTYAPAEPDGTWQQFSEIFDLQSFVPASDNQLHFLFTILNINSASPLQLGNVHVDYRK